MLAKLYPSSIFLNEFSRLYDLLNTERAIEVWKEHAGLSFFPDDVGLNCVGVDHQDDEPLNTSVETVCGLYYLPFAAQMDKAFRLE